jgi:hypothetical protein
MESLLLSVAKKCVRVIEVDDDFEHGFNRVLRETLLPLLEAGAKCRLVCVNREVAQEYDAAVQE